MLNTDTTTAHVFAAGRCVVEKRRLGTIPTLHLAATRFLALPDEASPIGGSCARSPSDGLQQVSILVLRMKYLRTRSATTQENNGERLFNLAG